MNYKIIIDNFSKAPTESNMLQMISFFESSKIHNEEIAYLAETLANSGEKLSFDKNKLTCDIASTGGPSSLSTLLCPLYLTFFKSTIPKLSVPGSPAGGIDILYQIPNYQIHFNANELQQQIYRHKYIHFLADKTFCPLDIILFRFREKINKTNVVPLVIASILSKKIALGINRIGLDIRVWPFGNFGNTFHQARENAFRFIQVAKLCGIESKCYVSDIRFPLQPYIGRGEALLALNEIFNNTNNKSLISHTQTCYSMSAALINTQINHVFERINLKKLFERNLIAQGSSYESFQTKIRNLKNERTIYIKAVNNGFLNIDLQIIKKALLEAQNYSNLKTEFKDPCGIILVKEQGEYVKKNEPIAILRINISNNDKIIPLIKSSLTLSKIITSTKQFEVII